MLPGRQRRCGKMGRLSALGALALALGIAWVGVAWWRGSVRQTGGRVIVTSSSKTTLRPIPVPDPDYLRWRDIGDVRYSEQSRESFSYASSEERGVTVRYEPEAETLQGSIEARGLKPWFAYQIKLVGAKGIVSARASANRDDPEAWSSYRLGRLGRWWCEQCHWNLGDRDVRHHLRQRHTVKGYLLFDWFVTDTEGSCSHEFSLDRSLHVIWWVGQRDAEPNDSQPRWYEVMRGPYGYNEEQLGSMQKVGLYGEWEPGRARMGAVALPPGDYRVRMNVTEESFHANLHEEVEAGGLWAWVLEGDLEFQVCEPARERAASRPAWRARLARLLGRGHVE